MAIHPPSPRQRGGASSPRRIRSSPITKTRLVEKGLSHKQLDSFDSFEQLPPELRLKIWGLSLPSPRLVSIQCGSNSISLPEPSSIASHPAPSPNKTTVGCTSATPVPVSLHVCSESRSEALLTYRPLFGFARGPGQILFNPQVDIMYFGPREGFMAADSQFHTCMMLCDPAELASVRRLAINDALFWIGNTYNSMTAASFTVEVLRQVAMRMTGLEELIFVPWEDEERVHEAENEKRMAQQIQTAMETIAQQYPSWEPPSWKIMTLGELPSMTG